MNIARSCNVTLRTVSEGSRGVQRRLTTKVMGKRAVGLKARRLERMALRARCISVGLWRRLCHRHLA